MSKEKDRYAKSRNLMRQAERVLAGGVGSNFRRKEKPFPLYFSHGEGPYIWDVDGNRYIDFCLGQGPLLLGHCHPVWVKAMADQLDEGQIYAGQSDLEIALSRMLKQIIPGADLMRYGNSSSEIIQLALRIARAYTGRPRWVKMEGHYHGWFDNVLASIHPTQDQAGSLEQPNVVLHSLGQNRKLTEDVLISHFNDLDHLEKIFNDYPEQIAAVMMEPIMCNSGCIIPKPGYLEGVRKLCQKFGTVLIFDETITGFRLAPGGATELFGVKPDLSVFGKGLGGGIPISCLVGNEELMKCVSDFTVFHAGTFNTNMLALRGALTTLQVLMAEGGKVFQLWNKMGENLRAGLYDLARRHEVNLLIKGIGQITYTNFGDAERMETYRDCWEIDEAKGEKWASLLKEYGVRIISRGIWYLSALHTQAEIDMALSAADTVLSKISRDDDG